MNLILLAESLAVVRLPADEPVPPWVTGGWYSVTRTDEELSLVCSQAHVPEGVQAVSYRRALKVQGPLDFSEIGILAALSTTLSNAAISIFAVSTYDTDYILVRSADLESAVAALAGERLVLERGRVQQPDGDSDERDHDAADRHQTPELVGRLVRFAALHEHLPQHSEDQDRDGGADEDGEELGAELPGRRLALHDDFFVGVLELGLLAEVDVLGFELFPKSLIFHERLLKFLVGLPSGQDVPENVGQ